MLFAFKSTNANSNIVPIEKRLRLFNPFPGCYDNLKKIIEDLDRIALMGFRQIWINPFYKPCQKNPLTPHKFNCPYAMQDHTSLNPEYGDDLGVVAEFTRRAAKLGLVPLFDLVARHIAIDHPIVAGDVELIKHGIDTTKWFKRHPNGNFVIKGLDADYKPTEADPWSDVVEFNYDDPLILKQIFEYFWKPFIVYNIQKLGFMGARLDVVWQIPRAALELLLPFIQETCLKTHQREAYLVAETLAITQEGIENIKGLVTHTMNSVYWMPGPEGRNEHTYNLWLDDNNWYELSKKSLQQAGPSAGFAGSHDEQRYTQFLEERAIKDPVIQKQRMLESMMVAAFSSDGGHIVCFGDEYGIKDRISLVQKRPIRVLQERQFDLTTEIAAINKIVASLPIDSQERTQRVMYAQHPSLVIFIVHQETRGETLLIIGNSYDEGNRIVVDQNMLSEIMNANGRNKELPESRVRLFACGNVSFAPEIDYEKMHAPTRSQSPQVCTYG